jgi:type VI secretion system secreted protein Hcp
MADKWFLKIDGIEGESTHDKHKAEIDVMSWSWGVSRPDTGSGPGGGGGAGKAEFHDFHFVARISAASPKLFLACATGVHHKWAALTGVRSGAEAEYLKYKLSDVQVTTVQHGDSEGDTPPVDSFSLSYGKFELTYSPVTAKGTLGGAIKAGYDLKQNKKI